MLGAHYSEKCMDELQEKMDEFLEDHSVSVFMDLVSVAIIKKFDALSEELEPVEPKCTITSHGFHYDYCGDCGALLPVGDYGKAIFCPACGRPVKWDE